MSAAKAIEFFSGIGAFAQAAGWAGLPIVAAFDQSAQANSTYRLNYGQSPRNGNLDSLKAEDVPPSEIWWLSPPCKPFTVRGKGQDDGDRRALCFANILNLLPKLRPQLVFVENVLGFCGSKMHAMLLEKCAAAGLRTTEVQLCPTMFGVPMRRPRLFVIAAKDGVWFSPQKLAQLKSERQKLSGFLEKQTDKVLELNAKTLARYGSSFHIIDALEEDAVATCFTSGYGRCLKAAGSFLQTAEGGVRYFSPEEQLALFGFRSDFAFPPTLNLRSQFRLIGNTVDVRAIKHLLSACQAVCS
jgi:site-specific DNA-cytosine methylase